MPKDGRNPIPAPEVRARQQRTEYSFPKNALEEAIRVSQAIEDANGGQPYPPTETALAMSVSPGKDEFRNLLSSSFRYGLTKGSYASERISIEPLGRSIVEPQSHDEVQQAKVGAALTPSVFHDLYERFRGKKLPESRFLQNTVFREFNIPKEQAELCVNNFIANMEFAGLVHTGDTGKWLSSEAVPMSQSLPIPAEQTSPNGHDGTTDVSSENQLALPIEKKTQQIEAQAAPQNQRVFITHGKNQVIVAQLKDLLSFGKFVPIVAEEHETPSRPVPEKVLDDMRSCFAGVIHVASEDELLDKEGNVHHKINENVLIEIGAAMAIYKKNYILLVNKEVHLPSNLQGLYACYYEGEKLDYEATMKLLKAFSEFK